MAASTAMVNASNYNQKPFLIQKMPLMMLKDYLLDDLSSCSSSGFKSFPRQQCCTTVRFLLEIDLNNNNNSKQPHHPQFKQSISSSSATITALQKASKAFVNAVKLLPFPSTSSVKSSSSVSARSRSRKGVLRLPRSISRKLFKKRKVDHREREIGNIRESKMFSEFLEEKEKPSSDQISAIGSFTCSGDSTSSSTSNSNNNSWTESEFTGHSSCSESYSSRNGAAVGEKEVRSEKKVSDGAGETVGGDPVAYSVENTKEWANEEEKEQFSPVSVLDCPFQDEEEDTSSPFQRSLLCIEGSKQKFMAKMRKFESLAGIKPVNLEQKMDQLTEVEDEQHNSSTSKYVKEDKDGDELLKLVKGKIQLNNHLIPKADILLLDFFKEKIIEKNGSRSGMVKRSIQVDEELEIANQWLNGQSEEMFFGWEVKEKRHVYIRDMETNGKWINLDEDKQELASELELQLFTSLVNEALLDLRS